MRIKREHLSLLFNQLYDRGDHAFTIQHPCDEIGVLTEVELGPPDASTVRFEMDRDAYSVARNEAVLSHGSPIETDLPHPDDFCNVAVASGLVEIDNLDEVSTFLRRYGDPKLTDGHPPVFAGFDTNLMPWRIDRILGLREPDAGVGYVNGFALSAGVRDELEWGKKCHDTDPFIEAYGSGAEEFWNQPYGGARISRLGLAAYLDLRDIQQAAEVPGERGDEAIIAAYDAWEQDIRGRTILFSDDSGFVDRAISHTILAQRVKLPRSVPSSAAASWGDIELLVYLLTVVFGIVELPGVTLHGVWRGKEGADWQAERVKLACRSPTLRSDLENALSIVESFEELRLTY